MFGMDRMARTLRTKLANRQNLSALTPAGAADFGMTAADVAEAAQQRADVLERLALMSEIHGAAGALKAAGRNQLFEMARTCDRCPHERKCARALYSASKPCLKDVDFCPNAPEYAALTMAGDATHA